MPLDDHTPNATRFFSSLVAGVAFFLPRLVEAASLANESATGDAIATNDASALSLVSAQQPNAETHLAKRATSITTAAQLITSADTIVAQVSHSVTATQGLTVYEIKKSDNTHQLVGQFFLLADNSPVDSAFSIASTDRDIPMQPSFVSKNDEAFIVYEQQEDFNQSPQAAFAIKVDSQRTVSSKLSLNSAVSDVVINPHITVFSTSSLLTIFEVDTIGMFITSVTTTPTNPSDQKPFPSAPEVNSYQYGQLTTFSDGSALAVYESKATPKTCYAKPIATDLSYGTEYTIGTNRQLPQVAITTGDVAAILTKDENNQNLYLVLKNKDGSEKRAEQRVNLAVDTHPLSDHRIEVNPATGELAIFWDRQMSAESVSVLRFVDKDGNIQGNKEIETALANNPGMPSMVPVAEDKWSRTHCPTTTSIDIQSFNSATAAPTVGIIPDQQVDANTAINLIISKSTIVDPNVDHQDDLNISVTFANGAPVTSAGYTVDSSGPNINIQHPGLSDREVNFKVTVTDLLGPRPEASATFKLIVGAPVESVTTTTQNSNPATGDPSISTTNSPKPSPDPMPETDPSDDSASPVALIIGILGTVLTLASSGGAALAWCLLRNRSQTPDPVVQLEEDGMELESQLGNGVDLGTDCSTTYNPAKRAAKRKQEAEQQQAAGYNEYQQFPQFDNSEASQSQKSNNNNGGYVGARIAGGNNNGDYDSVPPGGHPQYESIEAQLDIEGASSAGSVLNQSENDLNGDHRKGSKKGSKRKKAGVADYGLLSVKPREITYEGLGADPKIEYGPLGPDNSR